jgi:tRNA (adenine37-N6)-methyltransferase
MTLVPVATVHSCFGGKFGVPRQPGLCPSAWGRLVFHEAFRTPEAIRGIEGFSHLWLVFGFHQTAGQGWSPTVRPPRLGGNLGLSLVRLEGIDTGSADGPALLLGGLDLIDGTPVYDIKPYLPYAEAIPDAAAGFAADEIPRLAVVVADEAAAEFSALPERSRLVIRQALALDPRPAVCADDDARVFGATLCGVNVRFTISSGLCRILEAGKA